MAEKTRCEICDRTFKDEDSLVMHNKAKHPEKVPKERKPLPVKKIRNWTIFIIVVGLIVWGVMALIPESNVKELNVDISGKSINIPSGAVHWHPRLTIKIDGSILFPSSISKIYLLIISELGTLTSGMPE